jgi:hypothetical protein
MSADTHTTRIGIMFNFVPHLGFNVRPDADVPGFRISPPEGQTATNTHIDEWTSPANSSNATAYAFNG